MNIAGEVIGEPGISLEEGLKPTYEWIEQELSKAGRVPATAKAV